MKHIPTVPVLFLIVCFAFAHGTAQVPTTINVEIDWMETTGHSHRPNQDEIDAVVQMFACQGITLNVELSNPVPHVLVLQRDPSDSTNFFGYFGTSSFGAIKAANFNHNTGGWHYCIFAHQYQNQQYVATGSSGLANGSSDLIVTLGAWDNLIGSPWDRAATLAHELGHNLGLSHVGSMNENTTTPYVVNLPSIMTYYYQLTGVKTRMECLGVIAPGLTLFKDLDYSHGISCALDELALNENVGMGIVKVDWDCSGTIGGTVMQDLAKDDIGSSWCSSGGPRTVLVDYNEWANIRDVTAAELRNTELVRNADRTVYSCITYDEAHRLSGLLGSCEQPVLISEPCISNRMYYVQGNAGGIQSGSCTNPFVSVTQAYNAAGDGDILYFSPGAYGVGTRNAFTKRLLLAGPGGITIGTP